MELVSGFFGLIVFGFVIALGVLYIAVLRQTYIFLRNKNRER